MHGCTVPPYTQVRHFQRITRKSAQSLASKGVTAKVFKTKRFHASPSGQLWPTKSCRRLLEIEEDPDRRGLQKHGLRRGRSRPGLERPRQGETTAREAWAEYVGAADSAVDPLLALLVAEVVITKFLACEGWGATASAVGLGEIADEVGQISLKTDY